MAVEENGRLLLRFRLKGRDNYAVVGLPLAKVYVALRSMRRKSNA